MKNGDRIRVLQMEDHNGMDTQAIRMNGKTYTIDYLDDAGQIHLQESGLAVIPDVDRYVVIERGKEYDSIQEYDREILAIYDVITDYIRINEYVEEGDGLVCGKHFLVVAEHIEVRVGAGGIACEQHPAVNGI